MEWEGSLTISLSVFSIWLRQPRIRTHLLHQRSNVTLPDNLAPVLIARVSQGFLSPLSLYPCGSKSLDEPKRGKGKGFERVGGGDNRKANPPTRGKARGGISFVLSPMNEVIHVSLL